MARGIRKQSSIEITGFFGTRWVFTTLTTGIGIKVFAEGNDSGMPDLQVGLGSEKAEALAQWFRENF